MQSCNRASKAATTRNTPVRKSCNRIRCVKEHSHERNKGFYLLNSWLSCHAHTPQKLPMFRGQNPFKHANSGCSKQKSQWRQCPRKGNCSIKISSSTPKRSWKLPKETAMTGLEQWRDTQFVQRALDGAHRSQVRVYLPTLTRVEASKELLLLPW